MANALGLKLSQPDRGIAFEYYNPGFIVHEIICDITSQKRKAKLPKHKGMLELLDDTGPHDTDIEILGFVAAAYRRKRDSEPIKIGAYPKNYNGTGWPTILEFSKGDKFWSYSPSERAPRYAVKAMAALLLDGSLTDQNLGIEPVVSPDIPGKLNKTNLLLGNLLLSY